MSDPSGTKFDGLHTTPYACGPLVPWRDEQTQSRLWTQPMRVAGYQNFRPLERDTILSGVGAFLVEETQPRSVDGSIIYEWERIYAQVPGTHTEPAPTVFNYQITNGVTVIEIPMPVAGLIVNDYFRTTRPEKIQLFIPYKVVSIASRLYTIGNANVTAKKGDVPGGWIIGDTSTLERWRGNIFRRSTLIVPQLEPTAAA